MIPTKGPFFFTYITIQRDQKGIAWQTRVILIFMKNKQKQQKLIKPQLQKSACLTFFVTEYNTVFVHILFQYDDDTEPS